MPRPRRAWPLVLILVLVVTPLAAAAAVALRFRGAADPCPTAATPVVVTTASRTLWLCEGGRAAARFPVALGSRGTGKRIEGDRKTPLGTYTLGSPRPSSGYGTFIPVGYPTDEERRRGFTGSAVGIHGPRRQLRWAGPANAWLDWTGGCIALPDDAAIARVAALAQGGQVSVTVR